MNKVTLNANEIRDYMARAPKTWFYRDGRMVNTIHVRLKWLADIARGNLHEKINRRAGICFSYEPWKYPVGSSIRRNSRNKLRIRGLKPMMHII